MSAFSDILDRLKSENRLRQIPGIQSCDLIDLSSNDYLGLVSRSAEFKDEFLHRFSDANFSSSASRLLSTQQKYHLQLEEFLAALYGKEALLFNSGYHANVGCIGALTLPSTLFICDKLIHASVIDGLKINGANFKRFPHNDLQTLRRIIEKESDKYSQIIVVVESVYSMDGDQAPLVELAELRRQNSSVMLYVDEAHAFGVEGPRGLGLCEKLGLINDTDILIGTFGKAAASVGAFAIVSEEIKSTLVNMARPFIFSTALPPVNVAWSMLMTEKITGMSAEREHLKQLSHSFSTSLSALTSHNGFTISPEQSSQIIPYITGDAALAIAIAAKLKEAGVLALPIRRPTVPPGGERIRFSLSAALSEEQLRYTADIMEHIINIRR